MPPQSSAAIIDRRLKKLLRRFIPRRIRAALHGYRSLPARVAQLEGRLAEPTASAPHSSINAHERRVFSQNGEDGILEYIFQMVGVTNRTFVEFGVETGRECNTANLSLNRGWRGLLMDVDEDAVKAACEYYAEQLGSEAERVKIVAARVTPDNINALLRQNDIAGVIDLLSVDIDGNDLWVWQAIELIQPRVVVIEYNASLGPTRSLATVYDAAFNRFDKHPSGLYHGASLMALARVGRRRGYLLVGCESTGTNAFFVWEAAAAGSGLGEVTTLQAFYPMQPRTYTLSVDEQFDVIKGLEFVEI